MKTTKLLLIPLIILLLSMTACSTTKDPAEMYQGESAEHIFKKGEEALRDKSYSEATKRFEALDIQYPFGRDTETAQLQIIYAYYMASDYASAESAADRFIHSHPVSPHVDYALYMRGMSNYYQNLGVFERVFTVNLATRDLTQIKKSYLDFAELYKYHPNSRFAPAAHQQMVFLRGIISDHEMDVAKYYYEREAYVAAANRANLVIRHYQGTPAVPNALVLMVKSYRKLGLTKDMDESMQVLQYNYPNSSYVQEALKN